MTLQQGTRLGHYEIRSLVGAGGLGEIYLANDLSLHRPVGIKLLPADLAADEDRLERFKREAYAASSLNHPNILTIFEIGREGESYFLVTEFVDGESLAQHLQRDSLALTEALEVAIQVASALAAAHAAGILHRDIKPDNIVLRRDRLIKVVDFGVATLSERHEINSETQPLAESLYDTGSDAIGTAPYMSPEQVRGLSVDARTDIWSLGVVLYQMVTGHLPFAGKAPEVFAEILKTDPPVLARYLPRAPNELERIVIKCLRKGPEERYQMVKELGLDLKSLKQQLEFEELRRGDRTTRESGVKREDTAQPKNYSTQVMVTPTGIGASDIRRTSSTTPVVTRPPAHNRRLVLALCVLAAIAGMGGLLYSFRSQLQSPPGPAGAAPEIVPFTSSPGNETAPSFAPDGNRIAFAWNGGQGDNTDIYVKQVGTDDLQRLTTDPAADIQPRWSRDGLHIAFLRQTAEGYGLYLIPSIGGTERQLTRLSLVPPIRFDVVQVDWSPDGTWLAVSDRGSPEEPFSIFAVARDSGEKRRLTSTQAGVNGDFSPAVSPDGKTVAYRHFEGGGLSEIYLVPVAGGEARRLTFGDAVKSSPAWTPDGRDILFLAESGSDMGLWRVPAAGGTPDRVEAVGTAVTSFALSRQGNRLAWTQTINDSNIWQVDLSGTIAQRESARMLISSTKIDVASQFSPDGKRIVFASTRSGRTAIWMSDGDGQRPAQVASFGRGSAGSPRWSPDGRWIVFDARVDGNADIYRTSPEGGKLLRLTTESSEDIVPSVSRDGQWIYFCSNRSGTPQIWKMPADGGSAVQVTKGGGFDNVESPDGRYLYYAKGRGQPGIWRLPVAGGDETPVLDKHRAGLWRQWAVVEQGIFFITAERPEHPVIEFFRFADRSVTPVMTLDKRLPDTISGLAVSPDGRRLIWAQLDHVSSDISLIENFH